MMEPLTSANIYGRIADGLVILIVILGAWISTWTWDIVNYWLWHQDDEQDQDE